MGDPPTMVLGRHILCFALGAIGLAAINIRAEASRGSRWLHRRFPLAEVAITAAISTFRSHGKVLTHEEGDWPAAGRLAETLANRTDISKVEDHQYVGEFEAYSRSLPHEDHPLPAPHALIVPLVRWGIIHNLASDADGDFDLFSAEIRGKDRIQAALDTWLAITLALTDSVDRARDQQRGLLSIEDARGYVFATGYTLAGAFFPTIGSPTLAAVGGAMALAGHGLGRFRSHLEASDLPLMKHLRGSLDHGPLSLYGSDPRLLTPAFYEELMRVWHKGHPIDLGALADETLLATNPREHSFRRNAGLAYELPGEPFVVAIDQAIFRDPDFDDQDTLLFNMVATRDTPPKGGRGETIRKGKADGMLSSDLVPAH